ncbi:MAG: tRNA uridine-5-carboxymethylaminomethyl(34) synthesis GTPase MnmE [Opitutales bacterium]|nr:tRNA uridine-5-carboxymethylaminomethyl(34) synthesis GTPase MnmE [Opitutales bacterium]
MSQADTIVALATPAGESAIGVVRLSGDACDSLSAEAFGFPSPTPRTAHLATYRNLQGEALDQTVFIYYETGRSYTGQPSLEIFCHGNPLILRKVVDDLLKRGCRLAEPGEFTRMAYTSGKMELVQAEAVATLIRARSDKALEIANRHLRGDTGKRINLFRDRALALMAQLEAYVDFPHEDLPREDMAGTVGKLETLSDEVSKAAETGKYAHLLEAGVRTLVAGAPNAGKSSLMNALCGKPRAIVSEEAGTTRDYVGERLLLGSFEIELIDTAGIRSDTIGLERIGMDRTLDLAEGADFFLLTLDATLPPPPLPPDFLERLDPSNCIVVENKIDLPEAANQKEFLSDKPHVRISALTGAGIGELKDFWEQALETTLPSPTADALVVNARHAEHLSACETSLRAALQLLRDEAGIELALGDLRLAIEELGEIVGSVDNEDMLDHLFETFCIGK